MREKVFAVVAMNNEGLKLIYAHYFSVCAAHNSHVMRRNQLRSSHRQSDLAIKGFLVFF